MNYFKPRDRSRIHMSETRKLSRYICLECAYIYDPVKGDQKGSIPSGTPFESVPDTWMCPECKIKKAKKGVFKRLDD
jgi:rubredoxin